MREREREREEEEEEGRTKCGEKRRAEKGETDGLIGIDTAAEIPVIKSIHGSFYSSLRSTEYSILFWITGLYYSVSTSSSQSRLAAHRVQRAAIDRTINAIMSFRRGSSVGATFSTLRLDAALCTEYMHARLLAGLDGWLNPLQIAYQGDPSY